VHGSAQGYTRSEWAERLRDLSPDARAVLRSKMRTASLARWIEKTVPKHAPIPPHLRALIRHIERAEREPVRLLVSMPPRHAKTVTLLAGLAWMIDRHPGKLNAFVTYSGSKAKSKSRTCRRLARAAGVILDDTANSAYDWRTPLGGGLLASGIGGGLTGEGVDGMLVIDDPFKGRAEAESPTMRGKVWDWFNDVAYTRLNPGASCMVVATRWHHDDLIGRLSEMGAEDDDAPWEVINFPAVREEELIGDDVTPSDDGYALWPERFPLPELRKIRRQVLEYGWASLFQGHPVPKGGAVFNNPARYTGDVPDGGRVVLAMDPAGTVSTKSDRTALVALWVIPGKSREEMTAYVLDVESFRAETAEAARRAMAFQKRWGGGGLAYETSRDGVAIAKAIKAIRPQLKLTPIAPRGDKLTRATPVAAAWNDGRVLVPMAGEWVSDFMHVVGKFTGLADPRDDEVDGLAHAWNFAAGVAALVGGGSKVVGDGSRYGSEGFAPRHGSGDGSRNIFG
jgi:predicted phage terminase large subunit-like protein